MNFTLFHEIAKHYEAHNRIYNLSGSSAALLLALCDQPFVAIDITEERCLEFWKDINFFRKSLKKPGVLFFPEPNGPQLSGERAQLIYLIQPKDSLVTSLQNIHSIVWTKEGISSNILPLRKGMQISRGEIEQRLYESGYKNVSIVSEKGEFSRRGWILDIFPSTEEMPLRIEFFGDEIEKIRFFDINSQRSTHEKDDFLLFPSAEPTTGFRLLEYFDCKKFFISDSVQERDDLPPDSIFLSRYSFEGPGYNAGLLSMQGLGLLAEERKNITKLPEMINRLQKENRIILIASSGGQAERLKDILSDGDVIAPFVEAREIFEYEGRTSITIGDLSSGLSLPGMIILTEKELFGRRPDYRPLRKSRVSELLISLDDLRPGNYVVHRDHGIGKFSGLVRQRIEGITEDLIVIEYEGGKLYLPLHSISKINTFHSQEGVIPKIDRLGGKTWHKTKEKVRKKIQDLAEKLVKLYAERKVYKGFSFSSDTYIHREFDSFFPYEATPDQIKAIEDIKRDMETEKTMERLICGDVGYGKTEVAMRAAFKALYDGMQVAVLVPTTILCEQHFRTFKARFAAFPITVDFLSRFKSKKEQKIAIASIANGDIDLIIGTHSLLGKDITFQNLGLLIIDEEHRFGVRQKEKIKEIKKVVDVLTLSATPIPRTLHMALSDIRDMSLIETPPEERIAVKSVVSVFNHELIQEAIRKENERNGQVFFVHNKISDIYKIAGYLKSLMPSLRFAVAHGQMAERDLEKIMLQFYKHEIDVLVSTAIIGSGLDIPTANTIIINRADTMGLADLYQLRGRVGRGNIRAYAYFLIPNEDIITEEARKRLQAIKDMSYLGAGFRLALKDMEIRGAGNLLGAEQSGHIHAVGFDLYMEILEKVVAELKGEKIEEEFEPSIRLKVNAFIPEDYISDISLRLSFYRKIASSKKQDALNDILGELEDRFGKIPQEVKNLIDIMQLKLVARNLLINQIHDSHGKVSVLFLPDTKIEPRDIFGLREKTACKIRFLPDGFELDMRGLAWAEIYKEILCLFTCLTVSDTFNKI